MPVADNSYAERLRRLRNRTLAIFHAKNPRLAEMGSAVTPDSIRLERQLGGMGYTIQPSENLSYETPLCCCAPGPVTNIQWTYVYNNTNMNYIITLTWDPIPSASSYTFTANQSDASFNQTGPTTVVLTTAWPDYSFPNNQTIIVTITAHNECGTSEGTRNDINPCFLAGSLVTMADGTTKVIEDIQIGDELLGAFGEINTVLALHRPLLGSATMTKINGEHSTSSHHPHISVDKKFYCNNVAAVENNTYGKEHQVIDRTGKTVSMMLHGLKKGRVQSLTVGVALKTVEGSRVVSNIEEYSLPADTQLYNLVMSGSHTYHVDGYAVTGWPREDDFDYDSWTPTL